MAQSRSERQPSRLAFYFVPILCPLCAHLVPGDSATWTDMTVGVRAHEPRASTDCVLQMLLDRKVLSHRDWLSLP